MGAAVRVENLSCSFLRGQVQALRDVDLSVEAGEWVFLTGPSGSGKSSLARALTGLVPRIFPGDLSGRIALGGRDIRDLEGWEIAQHVGMVFQRPQAQLFAQTVEEEVAFGPENLGLERSEVARRIGWALEVTGLEHLRDRPTAKLSNGQQQRVALASVLAMRPRVLLLDEPTSSLDEPSAWRFLDAVARLREEDGTTVLAIDHRTRYFSSYADRVVVLSDGAIAFDGPARAILDEGFCDSFGLRRAGGAAPPCGRPGGGEPFGPLAAAAREVAFAYERGRPVLDGVTLELRRGSVAVVVGPNGAGKTTLLRLFAGLLKPRRGELWVDGGGARVSSRAAPGISFVGQEPAYHLQGSSVMDELRSSAEAPKLIERFALRGLEDRHPLSLSEGEKRRLAMAAAAAREPLLLILDEPTMGGDGRHLEVLLDFLRDYAERNRAVLLASNDPDLLESAPGKLCALGAIGQG